MSGGRLGAVAVTDAEGGLLGIITDGDLRRMLEKYEDVDGLKARDIMSVSPKTIQEEELAYNAFQKMEQNHSDEGAITLKVVSLNWWSWTKIKNTREWFISTIY